MSISPPTTSFDIVLFFSFFAILTTSSSAIAYISASTPEAILCGLEKVPGILIKPLYLSPEQSPIREHDSDFCIDAVFDLQLSMAIRAQKDEKCVSMNANEYEIGGNLTVFSERNGEISAICSLLRYLHAEKVCLFASFAVSSIKAIFTDRYPEMTIFDVFIPQKIDFDAMKMIIHREIRPQNCDYFLFDTSPNETDRLLLALLAVNMDKIQIALLFPQRSIDFGRLQTYRRFKKAGIIVISEGLCEETHSECDFVTCKIRKMLSNSRFSSDFSIVNLRNNTESIIGHISKNETVSVCPDCFYLHTETTSVDTQLIPIQISFNNGTMNSDGDTDSGENEFYLGADFAVMDINNRADILPGGKLRVFNVTLGMNKFNETWAMNNIQGINESDMGVVFLHGHYSNVAIPVYDFLSHKLNYSLPQVGCDNTSPLFSSIKQYPAYTRVTMSNTYLSVIYINTLRRYGWTHVSILYCDDLYCTGLYSEILKNTLAAGIKIVNDEHTRKLPASMSEYPTSLIPVLRAIVESKVKIFMLILYGNTLFYTLDVLYDIGVRRDDFEFLSIDWLNPTLFTLGSDDALMHRKELLHGTLQFYPTAFAGAFGESVETHFKQVYGKDASHFACNNYDGVLLIAHAIDYMIQAGEDYENPIALGKVLKETKFVGCTGEVQIEEGTNDRAPMTFQILNAYIAEDGTATIRDIGTYNPTGLLLFNFTAPVIWPDNTTNTPVDTRRFAIDCPFDEKTIVTYYPGMFLSYSILLFASFISIIITIVIWLKLWNFGAVKLETHHEISFDDYVQFATIGIEALQYAAMGPDFSNMSTALSQVSDSLSWKLETVISLKHGIFWVVLNVTYGMVVGWVVLIAVFWLNLGRKWECACSIVSDIGEKLLPMLGNLCFLPIVSMLLNVFLCVKASNADGSVDIFDTFMRHDCYQSCWSVPHRYYAAASIVCFLLYAPIAICLKPFWQHTQISLHINSSPKYLMGKTVYQILIITGNKLGKDTQIIAHSVYFSVFTVIFLAFSCVIQPFSYSRANLWHFISLICVIWLEILNFIANAVGSYFRWLELFVSGVALICISGAVIQWKRIPSLLYKRKGLDIADLFRFQFSRNNYGVSMFRRTNNEAVSSPEVSAQNLFPPSSIISPF